MFSIQEKWLNMEKTGNMNHNFEKNKGNRNWSNIDREDEIIQQELENSSLKYDQSLKGKHEQNQERIKKIFFKP